MNVKQFETNSSQLFANMKNCLRFIGRARRIIAVVSLALLTQGQLLPSGGVQEVFTDVGFVGLVIGALSLLQIRESEDVAIVEGRGSSNLSWRLALFGLGVFGALCVQRWFVAGTTDAGGDITPPMGVAWIAKILHSFAWSGSNLGAPASNQIQLPWAAVAWLVHILGGSGALAQRVWISFLIGGVFVAAAAFARALELSIISGVVIATLYFFNPMTMSFVGDNTVFLVAMILVPLLASVLISYGARRARLWHVCLVFVLAAPFVGFAYSNPPIVLMVILTTSFTPILVWAMYGQQSAARALNGVLIGGFLLLSASAYWIIPALSSLGGVATSNLSTLSSWGFTESRSTLANGLWLNTTWAWAFTTYFPYAENFARFPLDLALAVVPLSAFAIISLRRIVVWSSQRASKLIGVVSLLSLCVIFFSTGTRSPGNLVFDPIYHLKFGWLLREPGRFLIAASFGYAILNGLLVEHFRQTNVSQTWRGSPLFVFAKKIPLSLVVAMLIICGGLAASYPLWTGAEISGPHDGFPSAHVVFPKYWNASARYLNSSKAPSGALMVLPANDFYQMPYTWYYGSDGFISNMLNRNVVVPSAQGYGLVSSELLNSVKLESSSLLSQDWTEAGRILDAVGTPIVLVRGDINSKFPSRTITSPTRLKDSLSIDPEMQLIHKSGPLSVYELKPKYRQAFSNFATVNSSSPNLKELAILPAHTALVSSKPAGGHISLTEFPSLSKWVEGPSTLSVKAVVPADAKYVLHAFGSKQSARLSLSYLSPRHFEAKVAIPIGKSLLENGDFSKGLWGKVGNCNAQYQVGKTDVFSASRIVSASSAPNYILQLKASIDSACESKELTWQRGNVHLTFSARTLEGNAPRICVLQVPSNLCATTPQIKVTKNWHEVRTTFQPRQGTTSLRIFLYADASGDGTPSIEQYAKVKVRQLPSEGKLILVGTPSTLSDGGLVTSMTGYSSSWIGPNHARHVMVNGLTNGWLTATVTTKTLHLHNSTTSVEWEKELLLFSGGLLMALSLWLLTRRRFQN
jgi:hypothetical protein